MLTTLLASLVLQRGTVYPMALHKLAWGADPEGFFHGVAFHYLAPKGWKPFAITGWNVVDTKNVNLLAGAVSPDDRFGYAFCPGFWQTFNGLTPGNAGIGGQMNGFQGGTPPPARLSDWMVNFLTLKKLDAFRIVSRADNRISPGGEYRYGQASQVRISYTLHGQPIEGTLVGRMVGTVSGNPNAPMQSYSGYWGVESLSLVTYPKGEEAKGMRFFSLAVPTYTPTPAFVRAVAVHDGVLKQMYAGVVAGAIERSRIQAKVNAEKEDALMGAYRSRQAANDKAQRDFCDYIGDIEHYHGKDGEEIRAASTTGGAWQNSSGAVLLSDDPHFDPNGDHNAGWTRLEKAP